MMTLAPGAAMGLLLALGLLGGPPLPGSSAVAQQFSADLVGRGGSQPASASGKVYVSNGKVRIETHELAGGFFLVDGSANTAYFVRPAQQVLMDAKQSSLLTQVLVPVDPSDPCRQWQVMAKIAGAADQGGEWRCNRLGAETVGERSAIKYQATSPQDRRNYGWIDPQLQFLIRLQGEDGATTNLEHIVEESQPASLFEIPADFRKFDPLGLIERVKRSDVWVETPR